MEKRGSTLEEHMNIIGNAHEKTASAATGDKEDLLTRLANELDLPQEKTANEDMGAAPYAEGEVSPADASVAGAAEPVVAATEGVTGQQLTLAGGNLAESAAGELPAATKPNEGTAASAGDGNIVDGNSMHRTPEAVQSAAESPVSDTGGDVGSAAAVTPDGASGGTAGNLDQEKTAEANAIGKVIANSFQSELEKMAEDRQYSEALEILNGARILDGYKINDAGLDKTASVIEEGGLDKIANNESLSRRDIISAAYEYVDLEKQAEDADAAGRADAQLAFAEELEKQAEDLEEEEFEENEKVAQLLKDPEVVAATKVLKAKGVI